VHLKPKRFPVQRVDWHTVIVAAQEEFLVVNKPPGIPVHATLDNQFENVLYQLHRALDVPGLPIHQLGTWPRYGPE
jgi:23S rRNA-/tRNA-specific pseudouridylate synthase